MLDSLACLGCRVNLELFLSTLPQSEPYCVLCVVLLRVVCCVLYYCVLCVVF